MSVIPSFDCLAMRDLSFVPQSEVAKYGTDKLDILTEHYGVGKTDASGKEHPPLIDIQATKSEYGLFKPLVLQQQYPRNSLAVFWKIIFSCHKDIFPNLLKLAAVALTVPVQTAICERGFSVQNMIMVAHRNRLGNKTLHTLMTISVEGPPVKDFDPSKALVEFKTKKQRRIFQKLSFDM